MLLLAAAAMGANAVPIGGNTQFPNKEGNENVVDI